VELVETSVFTRQITSLLSEEECRRFQSDLVANLAIGSVIRGGGGIRKVRVRLGPTAKSLMAPCGV
jgi:hypothetical protein